MKIMYPILKWLFKDDGGKSAKKAATSTIFAVTSGQLEGATGLYFNSQCQQITMHRTAYLDSTYHKIVQTIEQHSVS